MDRLPVTVFADASFQWIRHGFGHAGCGWWWKSATLQGEGSHQFDCGNNTQAETIALVQGGLDAFRAHADRPVVLILQSDSLGALGVFLTLGIGREARTSERRLERRKNISKIERKAAEDFAKEIGNTPVWLKHVKGHTRRSCSRSYVNRLTDRMANEARRKVVIQTTVLVDVIDD